MIGCILVISTLVTRDKSMLIYWIFIVGGHNVEFKRIIKYAFVAHIGALIFVVISCYSGIIENNIYYRNYYEQTGIRESLGFGYTSECANHFLYIVLMWIYIKGDKIKPVEWGLMILGIIFFYLKTDTKNATALGLLAIFISILLKYSSYFRKYKKYYVPIAILIVPFLAMLIIYLSYNYSESNELLSAINNTLSGRLYLAQKGLINYGISLFGQPIVWIGGNPSEGYNYVDSSYIWILLNYGAIIFLMIILGAMALGIRISQKKDTYFLLVISIIAVHSTFDPQLIWIGYNSFLMIYSYFKMNDKYESLKAA